MSTKLDYATNKCYLFAKGIAKTMAKYGILLLESRDGLPLQFGGAQTPESTI